MSRFRHTCPSVTFWTGFGEHPENGFVTALLVRVGGESPKHIDNSASQDHNENDVDDF
jgi:hypothetical protein